MMPKYYPKHDPLDWNSPIVDFWMVTIVLVAVISFFMTNNLYIASFTAIICLGCLVLHRSCSTHLKNMNTKNKIIKAEKECISFDEYWNNRKRSQM